MTMNQTDEQKEAKELLRSWKWVDVRAESDGIRVSARSRAIHAAGTRFSWEAAEIIRHAKTRVACSTCVVQ